MKRRDFIINSVAAASVAGRARAQDAATLEKIGRMTAMSGCFGRYLAQTRDWSKTVEPGQLDLMDYPEMLADRFGFHWLDMQQYHFLSPEPSYYRKFLERAKKVKSKVINVTLELDPEGWSGTVSTCSSDPQLQARGIELTKQWIDRAASIESPSVMLNQGTFGEDLTPAIRGLKAVAEYGKPKNVVILLEPRGKSNTETLVKVIAGAGIYANPDIGNFRDEESTYSGLRLLYPFAKTINHIKINPAKFDLGKCVQISKEMGFKGVYSFEGGGPEPYTRVKEMRDELLKVL